MLVMCTGKLMLLFYQLQQVTSEKEMSSSQLKLCPLADAGLGPTAWEQVSHLVLVLSHRMTIVAELMSMMRKCLLASNSF